MAMDQPDGVCDSTSVARRRRSVKRGLATK